MIKSYNYFIVINAFSFKWKLLLWNPVAHWLGQTMGHRGGGMLISIGLGCIQIYIWEIMLKWTCASTYLTFLLYSIPMRFFVLLCSFLSFLLCCFMFMHHSRNDLCHKELQMIHTYISQTYTHTNTHATSPSILLTEGPGEYGGKMYTTFILCLQTAGTHIKQTHTSAHARTQRVLYTIYDPV